MILNFWRKYPFLKPKKDGRYLCTTENGKVMDLFYDTIEKTWIDIRRQNVFDGYKCYKQCREPLEYNRVHSDSLCHRNDVIAWKYLPARYGWWRIEVNDDE